MLTYYCLSICVEKPRKTTGKHRKAPASKSEIKTWASTEPIRAVKLLLKFEIGCFPLICNNPGACSPD